MRVLKDMVLVTVYQPKSDVLIRPLDSIRRGVVKLTGSSQVEEAEEVLFGDSFEEILDIEGSGKGVKYLLMHEDNVKIVYGNSPETSQDNVLPFFREEGKVA